MNNDRFEGKWKEIKGKVKEKWGKLTDNDMMQIDGKYEQFLGTLQKRYGYKKEQAEEEFNNWNWGDSRNSESCKSKETRNEFNSKPEKRNCEDKDENDQHKKRKAG